MEKVTSTHIHPNPNFHTESSSTTKTAAHLLGYGHGTKERGSYFSTEFKMGVVY